MSTNQPHRASARTVRSGVVAAAAIGAVILSCTAAPAFAVTGPFHSAPAETAADAPWTKTVTYLVSKLTPKEKVALIHGVRGADIPDPHGEAGYLQGVKRLGIPGLRHADAQGLSVQAETTSSPSRIGLASTFSRDLLSEFGTLEGTEGLAADVDLLYSPQTDLARTPSWSRNNTAYSEDAYLAKTLVVEEVDGIQGTGLMSQVKHVGMYNGQNQDTPSVVEGQAAHEIYLAPAEAAAQAGVSSMMCSYATFRIKDDPRYTQPDYACANSVMQRDIIKGDWNFPGFITSDYGGIHATNSLLAGVDQEFRTAFLDSATLTPLIDTTSATYDAAYEAAADEAIARTLYQDERFGLLDNDYIPAAFQSTVAQHGDVDSDDNTTAIDKAAGKKLSAELAERSAVLLQNDNDVLPLTSSQTVNVVGQSSVLLPASPGGEKSTGFGDRDTIGALKGLQAIGGAKVVSNPGIDLLGTAIPAANLKQAATGDLAGLVRTTTLPGGSPTTSVDTALAGTQTDLVRGATYSWTGYIDVPTDDTYQLQIQRPYGSDSGNDSAYNTGVTRATGGAVSLQVDGVAKTLANPDTSILQNAVPSFASGTNNKIVADNGQYLGYDNTGAAVPLTPGRHSITLTYAPTLTVPATPTIRLAWSAKSAAVASAVAAAATNDVSVIFADDAGATGGENGASTTTSLNTLSAAQNSLITQVTASAHAAGKKVVVVLNTGSAIQTPWADDVDGILEMWYPGQEGGTATAKLLYGKANPGGHLTISFPTDNNHDLFTVVDGKNGERSVATLDAGETTASLKWTEGLNVGYRWFTDPAANTQNWDPRFAFGHGLSYTSFAYSDLSTKTASDGGVDVTFTVKNTGDREGIDAPQVYVGPSSELDPAKFDQTALKLVQFDDVKLDAGESKTLTLRVAQRELSSYSTENNNWVVGTGTRTFSLAAASDDIKLTATAKVVTEASAPVVTTQPTAAVTANAGATVTLTAAASGSPEPTVRWQRSLGKGSPYTDIVGADSATYTFAADVSARYRAVFSNDLGTVYSAASVVTVAPAKITSTTVVKIADATITTAQQAKLTITVSPVASTPTGSVVVHYGSATKTVTLTKASKGKVTVTLPKLKKGTYSVYAVYQGDTTHKVDTSVKSTLTVR